MIPDAQCSFCRRSPAEHGQRLCADCGQRYEAFDCPRCGVSVLRLRSEARAQHCSGCKSDDLLNELSAADRDRLGAMLGTGQNIQIIVEIRRLLGLELRYAVDVFNALDRANLPEAE
jgi:hypothetical protein